MSQKTLKTKIPHDEFQERIGRIKTKMEKEQLDLLFVYGDEYRRENLRYVSNYWPLFERGALVVPREGEPVLLAAPEGGNVCREMSAWPDIRFIPDFACVTVPDEIEYPYAHYTSFRNLFDEIRRKIVVRKVGIVGGDAMSIQVYKAIADGLHGCELTDANALLVECRLLKSEHEIACLKEAARIADVGYLALMSAATAGISELDLSAVAHRAAFEAGAEAVPFCLVSSGRRVETIIGRATSKIIEDGDMIMAALAVQYEGYIATINFPFVVGGMTAGQRELIGLLIEANDIAVTRLLPGGKQSELVAAVPRRNPRTRTRVRRAYSSPG